MPYKPYAPECKSEFNTISGMPAGGQSFGNGFTIRWHNGYGQGVNTKNGAFIEDVIKAVEQRISHLQDNDNISCRENQEALYHLAQAQDALEARAKRIYEERQASTPDNPQDNRPSLK